MEKLRQIFLFLCIIILAFFLRFFRISDTPHDLYVDEVSIGYNAYSILKTGKDEYGKSFPIFFKAFGEYKLPVYIYLTAASEAIFGKTPFAVRFPSALFGSLSVVAFMLLVKNITNDRNYTNSCHREAPIRSGLWRSHTGLLLRQLADRNDSKLFTLSGLLLAVSPWHLQFSRGGFEANVALFLVLTGTYFLMKSETRNPKHETNLKSSNSKFETFRLKHLNFDHWNLFRVSIFEFRIYIGLFFFILSLYTYNAMRIFVPVFLFAIFFIYRKQLTDKLPQLRHFVIGFMLLLLTIPFIQFAFSQEGMERAKSESFLNKVSLSSDNFFQNRLFLSAEKFLKNYLAYFSLDFQFFSGDQIGRHSVREMGMNYLWQLPFFILGLFIAIRDCYMINSKHEARNSKQISNSNFQNSKRLKNWNFLNWNLFRHSDFGFRISGNTLFLIWLLISPLPAAFADPNPHALRSLPMVIPVTYFTAAGILIIIQNLELRIKNYNSKFRIFRLSYSTFILNSKFYILHSHIANKSLLTAIFIYSVLTYMHTYYVHYPKRTDPDWSGGYKSAIEYAVANENKYDQIAITDEMSAGYIYLYFYGSFDPEIIMKTPNNHRQFGKYKFVDVNFKPEKGEKTLYIAPHWRDKFEGRQLTIIRNRGNDVVFRIWEIWEN